MEDERIIELFFDRSEEAIRELNEKYGDLCIRIAENILSSKQDAEECVNDTGFAVWNRIPPERPVSLQAYVSRIVRNLALKKSERENAHKRRGNHGVCIEELSEVLPCRDETEDRVDAKLVKDTVNDFLSGLKSDDRVLFLRRYWYSDSYEQLSRRSGMKEGAIRTRLSRIRKQLKEYLREKGVSV